MSRPQAFYIFAKAKPETNIKWKPMSAKHPRWHAIHCVTSYYTRRAGRRRRAKARNEAWRQPIMNINEEIPLLAAKSSAICLCAYKYGRMKRNVGRRR